VKNQDQVLLIFILDSPLAHLVTISCIEKKNVRFVTLLLLYTGLQKRKTRPQRDGFFLKFGEPDGVLLSHGGGNPTLPFAGNTFFHFLNSNGGSGGYRIAIWRSGNFKLGI